MTKVCLINQELKFFEQIEELVTTNEEICFLCETKEQLAEVKDRLTTWIVASKITGDYTFALKGEFQKSTQGYGLI